VGRTSIAGRRSSVDGSLAVALAVGSGRRWWTPGEGGGDGEVRDVAGRPSRPEGRRAAMGRRRGDSADGGMRTRQGYGDHAASLHPGGLLHPDGTGSSHRNSPDDVPDPGRGPVGGRPNRGHPPTTPAGGPNRGPESWTPTNNAHWARIVVEVGLHEEQTPPRDCEAGRGRCRAKRGGGAPRASDGARNRFERRHRPTPAAFAVLARTAPPSRSLRSLDTSPAELGRSCTRRADRRSWCDPATENSSPRDCEAGRTSVVVR